MHDGLGSPGHLADVRVAGGRITEVGRIARADAEVIDCDGLVVCPGFIDVHAHSDVLPLLDEPAPFKALQGVTTEVVGNCGMSAAPLDEGSQPLWMELLGELAGGAPVAPEGFGSFLDRLERAGPVVNVAALVGHGTLRMTANRMDEELRPGALERMRALAAEAFEAGAVGLSTGLIYPPGAYASTDEVVQLARVAATHGALYATHMRDEGVRLLEAVDEAIHIGRASGARVQVSHCKAAGFAAHGQGVALVERMREARREGVDVFGDQYPYDAGSTVLVALLPTSAMAGGAEGLRRRLAEPGGRDALRELADSGESGSGLWTQVGPGDVLVIAHHDPTHVGRTLADIAGEQDPWDVLCTLAAGDPGAMVVLTLMDDADIVAIMRSPLVGVGSDNGPPVGMQHPRTWGCFPRLLGTYVRDRGVLSWEEAIRKMTSLMARQFSLAGRGVIEPGAIADICVFDPATIGHAGTYTKPEAPVTGIEHVLLAGQRTVRVGTFGGERLGRVLRRGRSELV
jgi:N-acyl-D-amino-acid deacylase